LDYSVPFSAVSLETQSTPVYYRAIAEDFQFTYFVGCPPLLRSATALAATPTVFPEELLVPDGASEEKSV
jgi:predicted transcriptional regulator